MCVPRALGGGEVDPATMIRTIEIIAAADGAAGWSAMIGATSGVASAYLAEDAAREIYGSEPEVVSGGAFAPLGRATVVDGGYRVTGRWPFASGCEHCAWLMGGSVVLDGGQPRLLPSGMPDNRLMLFPAAQVRIIDTWDVAGLRGTGSHDIAVEDRFVPAARSLSLIADRPRTTGPLYAFPVFGLLALGIAGVALGIARRALDELVALAGGKTPAGSRRLLAERPVIQAEVARAEATLGAARAFLAETVGAAWERAQAAGAIEVRERARPRPAATRRALGQVYRRAYDRYEPALLRARPAARTPEEEASFARMRAASRHLAEHLGEAPALVLVLMPNISMTLEDAEGPLDVGTPFASVYPAVQNLMLAARGLGIGTTLTTVYRIYQDEVRKICAIPQRYEVVALVPMGRPVRPFRVGRRRPAEEVTHWDRFGAKRG